MAAAGAGKQDEDLFDAVHAVGMELCPALNLTIPVGKDSMSMRTVWEDGAEKKAVTSPMSLVVTGFAPVSNVRYTLTPQLRTDKGATTLLLIDLGRGQNRLGASALAQVYGQTGSVPADVDSPALLQDFFDGIQVNCWPITTVAMAVCSRRWRRWLSPVAVASARISPV